MKDAKASGERQEKGILKRGDGTWSWVGKSAVCGDRKLAGAPSCPALLGAPLTCSLPGTPGPGASTFFTAK